MYSFLFWLHMLISWWNVRLLVNMILHGLFFWIAHICSKTLRLYEELQCRKQFKPCLLLAFSLSFRQLYVYDTLQLVYFETPLHLSQLSLWKSWLQVLRLSSCFLKAAPLSAHYHAQWATIIFGYHSSYQQSGRIQPLTLALLWRQQYIHFLTEISWEKRQIIMNNNAYALSHRER